MQQASEFECLSRTMAPRIASLARHLCGREASDGAQEVFRELLRSWPSFRGESAATTWAHRLAVRTLVRFAQRTRHRHEQEPTETELSLALAERAVADFAENPFTALVAAERRKRVHLAMQSLSPPLRAALVLRVVEGLDYAAIAHALELPLGTVKSRIAAATLRLAERLQNLGAEA